MRFKALSDDYSKNANKIFYISYATGFILVIVLAVLFNIHIRKPNFDPMSILCLLIPYSALSIPNAILIMFSAARRNIIKTIGRNRYITINKDELLLDDIIDGRSLECSYAWEDIENIIVKNSTPFDKFNKSKTYTITFILNQAVYNYSIVRQKFRAVKSTEYLDSFFTVMHSKEIMDEIAKHWNGVVEELKFR